MTEAKKKQTRVEDDTPGLRQAQASDPLKSIWVGASAGTGKTKVLIDRLLRLMLPRPGQSPESATPPEKVLCLTFTKTAAAEMSNRIYERLGGWAVREETTLIADLQALMGVSPAPEIVAEARRLFARVLDTPGGLRIMTIHSFCQSVLKRFPVEAGLPPHFTLMDEAEAVDYLTRCLHDIIADAKAVPESALALSFSHLALHLDSASMSDIMRQIMAKRALLGEIFAAHHDAEGSALRTIAAIREELGVAAGETEASVLAGFSNIPAGIESDLRRACAALATGSVNDRKTAENLVPWLEKPAARAVFFADYRMAFFTQKNELRKSLATKAAIAACPDIEEILGREAARVEEAYQRLCSVRLAVLNGSLLTVAAEMVGHYARYKRMTDSLDFDDLIIRTCDLLDAEDHVPWVLFKLDGGIDHILVDEAQDTSPAQWRVVRALSTEFFSGLGTRDGITRTLFVVGDEKQSIFSFQGADPYAFARMQGFFAAKAQALQEGFEIFLQHSFRSTRTVLDVVDAVFSDTLARQGVVFDVTRQIRHLPFRAGHAGLVELWPLVAAQKPAESEDWRMPVSIETGDHAPSRLAQQIAVTIRDWLGRGEMLVSKARPLRAGDILILVQSRGAFVELLMRALKEAGVPVAGIDRMTLTEEIGVMDLIALAQFSLLPKDDLTLATLLKSPLIGLDEESLFALCHDRSASLWQSLQDKMPDVAEYLSRWIARSGKATPYEFFAEALAAPCPADPVSGRRAFYGRLGTDIHDALDEFLNSALHYEQSHTPALQKFADWFLRGETEIKREQEQQKHDQVRIMTVHASKGLQAPVVFLPDAARKMHAHNQAKPRLLWPESAAGVPLWSPRQEFEVPVYGARAELALQRQEEEYRRLLYVALTRAEDRLYICGYQGQKKVAEDCWYRLVERAFPAGAENLPHAPGGSVVTDEAGEVLQLRRLSHPQEVSPDGRTLQKTAAEVATVPVPAWVFSAPLAEPVPAQPLTPSRPGEDEPAAKGPLSADMNWKFHRGIIVHQILEVLPQLPPEQWGQALRNYLRRPQLELAANDQAAFAAEILAVLRHPDFAPIFGPGSRAEVPVTGLLEKVGEARSSQIVSGQIDRMLVTENEVLIVDYKTNRPPPRDVADVPAVYLKQLSAYAGIVAKIYPRHVIRCALLWTDGPRLMPVPAEMLR